VPVITIRVVVITGRSGASVEYAIDVGIHDGRRRVVERF
jgi:hypothetical protein